MTNTLAASEPPLLYDVPAAGRVLQQSDRKVRQLIARGHLAARRLPGGRVVIPRESLIEFVQNLPAWEEAQ